MSKLNRNKLKKMILQEFKMMGMADMQPMGKIGAFSQDSSDDYHIGSHKHGCDACGMQPCGCDEYNELGESFAGLNKHGHFSN